MTIQIDTEDVHFPQWVDCSHYWKSATGICLLCDTQASNDDGAV